MTDEIMTHRPVLLHEAVAALAIKPEGVYLDGTFGRGGHSKAVLTQLGTEGRLLALDQDPTAIEVAKQQFAEDKRFQIVQSNFAQMKQVLMHEGIAEVDGILLDIGVSSPQLDEAERGFSFMKSGPLDMRMNPGQGESAAQWLARAESYDIFIVLRKLGEEKFAKRIAAAIVAYREETEINDTLQLAQIISDAVPVKEKHKHPATRSFQAIRIHINRELEVLEEGLQAALESLAVGGRLAVISFHSLEDRMVKRFMRDKARGPQIPKGIPMLAADMETPYRVVGKAIKPGKQEIDENPRARSSVLRVMERLR